MLAAGLRQTGVTAMMLVVCGAFAAAKPSDPLPESLPFLAMLADDAAGLLTKGLHREELGKLNLPSGRVVALDPLVLAGDREGFTQSVPPGIYPVYVYWSEANDWGRRNAFAELRFSEGAVATWQIAAGAKQDPATLKPGEYFCYGVDAGMGGFMSPEAYDAFTAFIDSSAKSNPDFNVYDDVLAKPLEQTTPNRLMYVLPGQEDKNIAMFASGFGDGCYPSYFGMAADGTPVKLVTTFLVSEPEPDAAPVLTPLERSK